MKIFLLIAAAAAAFSFAAFLLLRLGIFLEKSDRNRVKIDKNDAACYNQTNCCEANCCDPLPGKNENRPDDRLCLSENAIGGVDDGTTEAGPRQAPAGDRGQRA